MNYPMLKDSISIVYQSEKFFVDGDKLIIEGEVYSIDENLLACNSVEEAVSIMVFNKLYKGEEVNSKAFDMCMFREIPTEDSKYGKPVYLESGLVPMRALCSQFSVDDYGCYTVCFTEPQRIYNDHKSLRIRKHILQIGGTRDYRSVKLEEEVYQLLKGELHHTTNTHEIEFEDEPYYTKLIRSKADLYPHSDNLSIHYLLPHMQVERIAYSSAHLIVMKDGTNLVKYPHGWNIVKHVELFTDEAKSCYSIYSSIS